MLQSLHIKNLALLEEVSLDFEAGFTAVTGETGAGKSILLGALSLLAGERADKAIIRQGAAACEVEASLYFAQPEAIDAVLAELGLPACEEGALILKRSVPRERAPKITVNGSLATLAALQRLGEHWIDFHGPSEPRRLLKESCQLELLDLFGRLEAPLQAYRQSYRAWRECLAEQARLTQEARLAPDQVQFLEQQLAKLEALDLDANALAELERDFQRLSQARELLVLTEELAAGLTGDEGVQARLAILVREAHRLEQRDPASRPLAERLAAVAIEVADLGAEFAVLGQALHFDPEQAEALQARMEVWLEAKRRHGGDGEKVAAAREQLRQRLALQGNLEGVLIRLEQEAAAAERAVRRDAATLRQAREKAGRAFARVATEAIVQLGFRKIDFKVEWTPLPEPGPMGDCRVAFLFSANVGEPPQPLDRIASSGELARVMLALKTVLADLDQVPVLVFDEVDANVGGEIGKIVGAKMAEIGRGHQVLCVTHLPQVAAQARAHLVVTKDQSGERAAVNIVALHGDRQARTAELARMLGDRTAKSALAHAWELLREGGPGKETAPDSR